MQNSFAGCTTLVLHRLLLHTLLARRRAMCRSGKVDGLFYMHNNVENPANSTEQWPALLAVGSHVCAINYAMYKEYKNESVELLRQTLPSTVRLRRRKNYNK